MREKRYKNYHVQNKLKILSSIVTSRNNYKRLYIISRNYRKLVKNTVNKENKRKNRLKNLKSKFNRNKNK